MRASILLSFLCICSAALQAASTPANALLVLEKQQNTLIIIDPASFAIVARVPVGADPHEVAVSDDGKTAYVSNYGSRGVGGTTISVVDLTAQKALDPIDLGALKAPHGMVFAGGKLYFTAERAKVVCRYDPATRKIDWVVGTGQNRTHMVVVSADLKTVFTSNVSSATVSIIEQAAAADWSVTNVQAGRGAEGMDLTPDGKELWVANAQDGTISVIDVATKKVVQTIPSTGAANRLKISVDGKYAFVSDMRGKDLLVVDVATRKEHKKITLPAASEGLLASPDGARLYTTLNERGAVAVIDLKTMEVVREVKTGQGPDGLAWAARK